MRTSHLLEAYMRLLESENRIREQQLQLFIASQQEAATSRRFAESMLQRETRRVDRDSGPSRYQPFASMSALRDPEMAVASWSFDFAPTNSQGIDAFANLFRNLGQGSNSGHETLTPEEIERATTLLEWDESMSGEIAHCPVTLQRLSPGDPIRRVNMCGHMFSAAALERVLRDSVLCPLCRANMREGLSAGAQEMNGSVGGVSNSTEI